MAVLETKVDALTRDVAEIKSDVKGLVLTQATASGTQRSRADLGTWVRAGIPWAIAFAAFCATIYNIVNGG